MAMFIIHQWNCQSFRAHGPEYIQSLKKLSVDRLPHVICLQETWYSSEKDHPQLNGYLLANFSISEQKRGGTAIYVKNNSI